MSKRENNTICTDQKNNNKGVDLIIAIMITAIMTTLEVLRATSRPTKSLICFLAEAFLRVMFTSVAEIDGIAKLIDTALKTRTKRSRVVIMFCFK